MDSLYSVEFLNILQFSGITNHKLKLKVGVPILLLHNLNQSIGLCNGTRLIVKILG
jgi:ATP-dependent DNA helicase PIF1